MLDAVAAVVDRHGWSNVTLVEGDAAVLDVGDQLFDGVLSFAVPTTDAHEASLHAAATGGVATLGEPGGGEPVGVTLVGRAARSTWASRDWMAREVEAYGGGSSFRRWPSQSALPEANLPAAVMMRFALGGGYAVALVGSEERSTGVVAVMTASTAATALVLSSLATGVASWAAAGAVAALPLCVAPPSFLQAPSARGSSRARGTVAKLRIDFRVEGPWCE